MARKPTPAPGTADMADTAALEEMADKADMEECAP
jgi:hypothetical protein